MRIRLILLCLFLLIVQGSVIAQKSDGPVSRIGVHAVDGRGEFYETTSGKRFVIRGANYHHLEPDAEGVVVDTLLVPSRFDATLVADELHAMRALGYNTVRTALDICRFDCITEVGGGIRKDYLDNIATFLSLAHQEGLFVILTSNDFPDGSAFVQRMEAQCCNPFDGYMNTHYLAPEGLAAWKEYWQTVIQGLIDRGVALHNILAYSVRGEMFFLADQPPLSLREGMVTTANGRTYDMTQEDQRRNMVEQGAVYWLNEMRNAIHELDPEALVTVGLYAPNEPNNWRGDDPRFVLPLSVLSRSEMDFFDIHPYPGTIALDALMQNFQVDVLQAQPLIIGEYGAFKFHYATPEGGAVGLRGWQMESCDYGVQGWLHWHWTGEDDHEIWTGTEEVGLINAILAPVHRPDPCSEGNYAVDSDNVALGKPVTASQELDTEPAENLVDGTNAPWGAGADAWQWVEIDLGEPTRVNRVTLRVSQYPNGPTRHRVWGLLADGSEILLREFNQFTNDDDTLVLLLSAPLSNVVAIHVDTFESVSWVAWREIEVYSGGIGEACIARAEQQVDLPVWPEVGAESLGFLAEGRSAIIDQKTIGGDGAIWYHLPHDVWVNENDVTLTGSCDALPEV